MGNLVKMDLRRMFHSTLFVVSLIIIGLFNILGGVIVPIITKLIAKNKTLQPESLSNLISDPFFIPLLVVLLLISIITFSYADFSNGFIKNLAGQIPNRNNLITSKFIAIGIHNFIFLVVGFVSRIIGGYAGSAFGQEIKIDALIPAAFATLLIKWMLTMAIGAILLFLTTAVRNKTLASIVGVIIGTGALGLVYMGLDMALANIFGKNSISVSSIAPDQLLSNVSVGENVAVLNAIIVSIVCSVIFFSLTIKVFKTRDIK